MAKTLSPGFLLQLRAQRAWNDLKENGWAVIPQVVTEELCLETMKSMEKWILDVTGKETVGDGYKELLNTHGMIRYPESLSHATFISQVREQTEVKEIFKELYRLASQEEEDEVRKLKFKKNGFMVGSFDRVNFQPSPYEKGCTYKKTRDWWHVDQRSSFTGFDCIQGYVDVAGTLSEKNAGLQVLEGSHHLFDLLVENFKDNTWDKKDWRKFTKEELSSLLDEEMVDLYTVNVTSGIGDLVLWDSRCIHQARKNLFPPVKYKQGLDRRFVIYTCWWPAGRLTAKDFAKRKKFQDKKWTSSHWPDCRARLDKGQTWGKKCASEVDEITKSKYCHAHAPEYAHTQVQENAHTVEIIDLTLDD